MEGKPYVYERPALSQAAIDKVNKRCYDNKADWWDRFPFPQALPGFITKYYNPKLGNRVLDIGSGAGVLAEWLSVRGFDVLCIDPSTEMVKRCRNKGLVTLQCTIQEYKPEGQFAIIMAILSLIHVKKAEFQIQLEKIAQALPENGILFLGMLEGKGEGFFEEHNYSRFFAYYSPEEIKIKTQAHFNCIDYYYFNSSYVGYMLFVLKKIK